MLKNVSKDTCKGKAEFKTELHMKNLNLKKALCPKA